VQITVEDDITSRLVALNVQLRSPMVTQIFQQGAELMRQAAQGRAPLGETGNLRAGVYTASKLQNNFQPLYRRNGQRVNSGLRKPPVRGQVLVISSTFYALWVEKGRKPRAANPMRGAKHERRAVGLQGRRKRGRPFFRPAVRATRPAAVALINRQLETALTRAWESGWRG
jgi:hypothetical protein